MRSVLLCLVAMACGAPSLQGPAAPATKTSTSEIAHDQPLGQIGLVPSAERRDDLPAFVPISRHALVVPTSEHALPSSLQAVGQHGTEQAFAPSLAQAFTQSGRTAVPLGCDDNQLDVVAFDGPRLPPGLAWILPPSPPAGWRPTPVDVLSRAATSDRRTYEAGPLTVELARTAPSRGTSTLAFRGRVVHEEPFERVMMEGAELSPLDLSTGGPGIPEPVAAWSLTDDAILVVLAIPGFEGITLKPWLVQPSGARPLDTMTHYLYLCAF